MDFGELIGFLLLLALVFGTVFLVGRAILKRRAQAGGYDTVRGYLQAVPVTEPQRLDAVDLAMKGLVLVVLGILFGPLLIIGLVPLYYGVRKITMTMLGFGLADRPLD